MTDRLSLPALASGDSRTEETEGPEIRLAPTTDELLVRAQLTAIAAVERLLAGEGADAIR